MAGIFISYRREDSKAYAGRLYDDLVARLGPDRVFIDIDTLRPGVDFVKSLDEAIRSCDAVLALIGPRWLSVSDVDGNRRLDNPRDFVRLEIVTALMRDGLPVVPVLVGDALLPSAADLPEPMAGLASRHAFDLSVERWAYDVEQLLKRLAPNVPGRPQPTAVALPRPVEFRAWLDPERIRGSGPERVDLVIENLGPGTTFDVTARRKDAGLDVSVATASVEVGARSTCSVGVELTPRSEGDLGPSSSAGEPRTLGFALHVGPVAVPAAAREIVGQYILMPAAVSLRLARRELEAPGAGTFELKVENPGKREVEVALEAEDHAGRCAFAFDPSRISVEPRGVARATLTVTPPDRHASDARWPFDVRARPIAPPGPPVQAEGVLVYAPLRIAVRLLQPEIEAVGPGVFAVEVENLGTGEIAVDLSATDAAHSCTYAFDRQRATIAPGAVAQFDLTVTPPDDHPPDARWRFDVLASPVGPRAETVRRSGALIYRPPTLGLTITPTQASARRAADYKVSVHNPDQISQRIRLVATDRTRELSLRWPERSANVEVELQPWQTTVVPLRVGPVARHRGAVPRTLAFSVAAMPLRPPGYAFSTEALFVALPGRRWSPGRPSLLIGAVIVLGLIAQLDVAGFGLPELLVAAVPMVGGIVLGTGWWIVLYPAGLAAWLLAGEPQTVREFTRSVDNRLVRAALSEIYLKTPDGLRDSLMSGSRTVPVCPPSCVTWWNILALAVLCAVIGAALGKILAQRIARQ
jgi:hypothetical protein